MIKALLIDLGDTIIDNQKFDLERGLTHFYQLALEPKPPLIDLLAVHRQHQTHIFDHRSDIEIQMVAYLRFLQHRLGLQFDQNITELEIEVSRHAHQPNPLPYIRDVLEWCHQQQMRIVVLSNSSFSSDSLRDIIKLVQLDDLIDEVLSSADTLYRKPKSYFFEIGIRACQVAVNDILYIGNDYAIDIIGANQVQLATCWYNIFHKQNTQNIPCLNIDHYLQLLTYLQQNHKL